MEKPVCKDFKDTRSGFGAGLLELGDKNPNVVALCADLIGSFKMGAFIKRNFLNVFFRLELQRLIWLMLELE